MPKADRPQVGILFVISSLALGGTEKQLASISAALQARGWNVTVYSTGGTGASAESFESGGVKVILPPLMPRMLRLLVTALHLFRTIRRERFAFVHFFLPEAYLLGAPIALLAGTKWPIMSRRSLNAYQSRHHFAGFLERCLHSHMAAILANSRNVAKQLLSEGVRVERLGLIYNGLNTELHAGTDRERIRKVLGIDQTALVFVIVANLIPYKGHLDLIEALGSITCSLPTDWRLLIVGRDDGAASAVAARSRSLGIADKIAFLGARNDIPDLLAASDIGILSSHEEGFSNAVLEGMWAGLPMIVTDVGGNAEAVLDGENGLVVPARDPMALGHAILRLASDPDARRAFGESGRRRVDRQFALSSCVASYEALYSGLQAGKMPGDIEQIRYGNRSWPTALDPAARRDAAQC